MLALNQSLCTSYLYVHNKDKEDITDIYKQTISAAKQQIETDLNHKETEISGSSLNKHG